MFITTLPPFFIAPSHALAHPLSLALRSKSLWRILIITLFTFVGFHNFISSGRGTFSDSSTVITADLPVTVVTAYYNIPSKRSNDSYQEWMSNFLGTIPCHLYIYTDAASQSNIRRLRWRFLNRTRIVIKSFSDLEMSKRGGLWEAQRKLDTETNHTKELYIIWNEKLHFVADAIRENIFKSNYFMWTDIGSFRNPLFLRRLISFPNGKRMRLLLGKDKVFLLQPQNATATDMLPVSEGELPGVQIAKQIPIAGGAFAGHRDALLHYKDLYYGTMDRLIEEKRFVGKDQNTISAVAAMHPKMFCLVQAQQYFKGAGDRWFYYLYFFTGWRTNVTKICHHEPKVLPPNLN
ncbi:hypothetical protein BV898_17017 [Hypsibius exemplaris]|uniref:Uncharacterized protein n=1 Tax=Hypsibius exemplaris TaxID=2072580 RepID=A0A9X6RMD7_HYPEX|nr:hypothetical protein BV898_17017 [Hypsibius exemplaris]